MVIAVSDLEFITKRSNGEDKTGTSRVRYGGSRHVFSVWRGSHSTTLNAAPRCVSALLVISRLDALFQ
ncbi:hypothetical protein TNCV_5136991 [Trichonephila clavipes]|nr:hypothetical protein TNCV_5136991 [Trichonephila clavipes]